MPNHTVVADLVAELASKYGKTGGVYLTYGSLIENEKRDSSERGRGIRCAWYHSLSTT